MSGREVAMTLREQVLDMLWRVRHGGNPLHETADAIIPLIAAHERAEIVAYIADQAAFWLRDGHCGTAAVVQNIADVIRARGGEGGAG